MERMSAAAAVLILTMSAVTRAQEVMREPVPLGQGVILDPENPPPGSRLVPQVATEPAFLSGVKIGQWVSYQPSRDGSYVSLTIYSTPENVTAAEHRKQVAQAREAINTLQAVFGKGRRTPEQTAALAEAHTKASALQPASFYEVSEIGPDFIRLIDDDHEVSLHTSLIKVVRREIRKPAKPDKPVLDGAIEVEGKPALRDPFAR